MKRIALLFALVAPVVAPQPRWNPPQQTPAVLDTLLARLDATDKVADLGMPTGCQTWNATLRRLCEGVIELRRSELSGEVPDITNARDILERVVQEEPKWVLGWYALGRLRMKAWQVRMVSHEGPLQMAGESNAEGAARAWSRAVELDPTFSPGLDRLARAPIAWTAKGQLKDRVAMLRKGRKYLSGDGIVGAALFELDAGFPDSAVSMLKSALLANGLPMPRGEAQITLARALYRVNKPVDGRKALLAGASETDSSGLATYREQISWVGDSLEMKNWEKLPPASRPAWLAAFWAKRDVQDGRHDGERLIEHYRRVNIAFEKYRMVAPFTGQQRMVGSPEEGAFRRELNDLAVKLQYSGLIKPDTLRMVREYGDIRASLGAQSAIRVFNSNQSQLDDRGLMFIRYGDPSDRVTAVPGYTSVGKPRTPGDSVQTVFRYMGPTGAVVDTVTRDSVQVRVPGTAVEIWRYNRAGPAGPLLLYFVNAPFQGSIEPNLLVPTLLAEDPATRNKICVLDPSLCPVFGDLINEIATGRITMGSVAESRQKGLEMIKEAVTGDAFPRDFPKVLHPVVQTNLLERAQGGVPRIVVAFALPGDELTPKTDSKGQKPDQNAPAAYPLLIEVSAARASDGKRIGLDSARTYTMPHTLKKGEWLSGFIEIPLEFGTWVTSVVISQPGRVGAILTGGEITVRDWRGQVRISDLVVGSEESHLKWHSGTGGQPVPLNPLNTFPVGSNATLYAQAAGLNPGEAYDMTIDLFEGKEAQGKPALSISSPGMPDAARIEISKVLNLNTLTPGKYLVRMTLTSRGESVVALGGLTVVKP